LDLISIGAGLGEYILQTHNSKISEDSIEGLNSHNPLPEYATVDWSGCGRRKVKGGRNGYGGCSPF